VTFGGAGTQFSSNSFPYYYYQNSLYSAYSSGGAGTYVYYGYTWSKQE